MEAKLFKIKDCYMSDNSIIHSIVLNTNHPIYNGHFPNQPVLPGVCSLQVIRECLSHTLKKDIKFTNIKECKFLSPIIPQETAIYTINSQIDNGKLKCNILKGDNIILKLKSDI